MTEKKSNRKILENYSMIVKAIAKTFGENCEVILHDVSDLEHSIIMIENGHLTGRKIGSTMTDMGLYFLKSDLFRDTEFVANYQTESKDKKKLKSTSIFIRDEEKAIIGFLCINYAVDYLLETRKKIDDFCAINKDAYNINLKKEINGEIFSDNINDLLDGLFKRAHEKVGVAIEKMKKNEKMEIVKLLNKKGVFLVKGNIDKIAEKLNVSRYTIYNYLAELKTSGDIKII